MADTPTGETVTPEAPSNGTGTVAAPAQVNSNEDVEAAKKEAEQARFRANQLANANKALEEKLAEQERQKLEEKEEFKKLYEQTQAQLREREEADKAKERIAELSTATETVFKDYPANVVELAKTAGLSLSDDSDAAVNELRGKLDTFKATVGTPAPTASNPRETTPAEATHAETMAKIRGGDKTATMAYIREIPGIKRMKEIAQNGM